MTGVVLILNKKQINSDYSCLPKIGVLWVEITHLKIESMLFTKQKSIGPLLGLSNKILSILANQGAAKLEDVKFDQDFPKTL